MLDNTVTVDNTETVDSAVYDEPLKISEIISYGVGFIATGLVNASVGSFALIYMTNVELLDIAIVSLLMVVSRVLDGISDIVIGNIIDHTETRYGKARPWILRMCIPMGVSVFLFFSIPGTWPDLAKYVYFFVFYNIVNAVFYTFMQISVFALMSLTTSDDKEHGMLSSVGSIFGLLIPILINSIFIKALIYFSGNPDNPYTQEAFSKTIIFISIGIVLFSFICFFGVKEKNSVHIVKNAEKHSIPEVVKVLFLNKYWMSLGIVSILLAITSACAVSGNIYYSTYYLKDPGSLSWMNLCSIIPVIGVRFVVPFLFKRFGTIQVCTFGSFLAIVGGVIMAMLAPAKLPLMVGIVIRGAGIGMFMSAQMALLANVIQHTAKTSGVFSPGMGNAGMSAANKLGAGLGTVILGFAMSVAGFDASLDLKGLPQPAGVPLVANLFYIIIPAAVQVLIFILLIVLFRKGMED